MQFTDPVQEALSKAIQLAESKTHSITEDHLLWLFSRIRRAIFPCLQKRHQLDPETLRQKESSPFPSTRRLTMEGNRALPRRSSSSSLRPIASRENMETTTSAQNTCFSPFGKKGESHSGRGKGPLGKNRSSKRSSRCAKGKRSTPHPASRACRHSRNTAKT